MSAEGGAEFPITDAGTLDESKPPRVLSMLAAARQALSAEDVRPMGDRVAAQAAADRPDDLTATLHVEAGPEPALVLPAASAARRAYAAEVRHVGVMVPRGGLIAALFVNGVFRVEITAPAADLAAVDGGVHTPCFTGSPPAGCAAAA